MSYQPKSYRKFLATSVSAAMVATAFAAVPANVASANEQTSFSDVSAQHWASAEIYRLANAGIISGYEDGTFKPGQAINRGQAATLLAKAAGLDIPESVDAAPFSDVSAQNNFAPVLSVMKEVEFIRGHEDGSFRAGEPITREQMASILVRTFDLVDKGEDVTVGDLDSAHSSHQENIRILAQYGITNTADGNFRPKETVQRAQFAAFLDRALAWQNTQELGISGLNFVDANTVEVNFDRELTEADLEALEFGFDPALEVTGKALKEAEVSTSNTGSTVVLTTETQVEGTEYTLVVNGQRTNQVATGVSTPQPAELAVESVSANNLKTVKVQFNKEVDVDSLTDANVSVYEGTNTSATLVDSTPADGVDAGKVQYLLSEDKKEVTVVFGTTMSQSKNLRLVLDGVKSLDGDTLEAYEKSVTVTDTTIPTINSIKVNNAKSLEIQFSEPVNVSAPTNQVLANLTVDGNAVIGKYTQNYTNNTVTVTLATALDAGSHKINVKDIVDFNGLKAADKEFSVSVVEDTTPPEIVSARVVSKDKIEITTSEQLDSTGTIKVGNTTATVTPVANSTTKYELTNFGSLDLSAVVEINIKYVDLTDVVGNKVSTEKTFSFRAQDDTTLPTVSASVLNETGKKNDVKLKFSKPMLTSVGTIKLYDNNNAVLRTISVSVMYPSVKTQNPNI